MNITWIGARNHGPRRDGVPRALILHVAEGSLLGCDLWFNDPRNVPPDFGTSAHFCVGKTGEVHQYVDTAQAAYANGFTTGAQPPDHGYAAAFLASLPPGASPNRYSVSIEHEGWAGDRLTGPLFDASVELAASLFGPRGALANTPCDRQHVLRHGEIGGHPYCPGFPEEDMLAYVAAVQARIAADALGASAPEEDEMAVETHGLDQSATAAVIQRFVGQVAAVVADNDGAGMSVVLSGLPEMRAGVDYYLLALKREG